MAREPVPILKLKVAESDVWQALVSVDVDATKEENIARIKRNIAQNIARPLDEEEDRLITQALADTDDAMWYPDSHYSVEGGRERWRIRDEILAILNAGR